MNNQESKITIIIFIFCNLEKVNGIIQSVRERKRGDFVRGKLILGKIP